MTHGRWFWMASLTALLLSLGGACGGDSNDSSKDAGSNGSSRDRDSGSPGSSGGSGSDRDSGMSSGGGGMDTTGGDSGSGGSSMVPVDAGLIDEDAGDVEQCGAVTCAAPMCCTDPFQSKCGFQVNARACIQPQMSTTMSDARCPSVSIMGGAFMIPSCCTTDGRCGINAQTAGMGCIALEEVIAFTMMQMGSGMGGFNIDWPEPQACN